MRGRDGGYTLTEVVVSVSIMTIMLPVMFFLLHEASSLGGQTSSEVSGSAQLAEVAGEFPEDVKQAGSIVVGGRSCSGSKALVTVRIPAVTELSTPTSTGASGTATPPADVPSTAPAGPSVSAQSADPSVTARPTSGADGTDGPEATSIAPAGSASPAAPDTPNSSATPSPTPSATLAPAEVIYYVVTESADGTGIERQVCGNGADKEKGRGGDGRGTTAETSIVAADLSGRHPPEVTCGRPCRMPTLSLELRDGTPLSLTAGVRAS